MNNNLKAYLSPFLQLVSVAGIAICSLWFSVWYIQGEQEYLTSLNKVHPQSSQPLKSASFWDVTLFNALKFNKPVPYTAFFIVLGFIGGTGAFRNQHKINAYDSLDAELRREKSNHEDTLKNYNSAIEYIIHSMFVSTDDKFNRFCRITIYRHTNDGYLKKVYRHAEQSRFEDGGRLRIPDREGVVGAAWLNEGVAHISIDENFGTKAYKTKLENELRLHGAEVPTITSRMPVRDYFAMAVRGEDRKKLAIIVLESTEPNHFSEEKLRDIISRENGEIAKYIVHKGTLDEILNPDGGSDNG